MISTGHEVPRVSLHVGQTSAGNSSIKAFLAVFAPHTPIILHIGYALSKGGLARRSREATNCLADAI